MKIIVCVKQVPDTNEIKINPETGTLIREGVPSILNPDDANALEQALQVKDANPGTEVTAVSYTHLDVYKRQAQWLPSSFLLACCICYADLRQKKRR